MRKIWIAVIAVLALLFLAFVVWPAVELELMKEPMANALADIRTRNFVALRTCFTANAEVYSGTAQAPASGLIDLLQGLLGKDRGSGGSMYFRQYSNVRRHGRTVDADFQISINYENEDLPYRGIPIRKTGHVVLERQGIFTWKILRIGSDERVVRDLVSGDMLQRYLPLLKNGGDSGY